MSENAEATRAAQLAAMRDKFRSEIRFLEGPEAEQAEVWFREATEQAKLATCERSKCGSVIVNEGRVVGKGFNGPPGGREDMRTCLDNRGEYSKKVTEKTCCIHAEVQALLDALKTNPDQVKGSSLYFGRLDKESGEFKKSREPYCTSCSKFIAHLGVKEVFLWQEEGIRAYSAGAYDWASRNTKRE